MEANDSVLGQLREWLSTANPGLVTKADMEALEEKLDALSELVDELESRLPAPADKAR